MVHTCVLYNCMHVESCMYCLPFLCAMSSRGKGFDSNESPRPTRPAPWYALPVGWLCRDDRGAIWGWLSIVCLFLKWVSVAYSTSGPVATYILLASLSTQLGWYFIFVLLGRKSHKYLHQELPFTKVLQTFWVGAVVCPVAVYVVRAAVSSFMAFVPGFSSVVRPTTIMLDGMLTHSVYSTDENPATRARNEIGGPGLAMAFMVAYFSAGLAEELAKVGPNFCPIHH